MAAFVADDVRGHAQDRPRLDLEQVHRLIAFHLDVIGAGVFQRGLHIVHCQHRRPPEHPGFAFRLQRLDAGKEEVRAVRIDGGQVHARSGRGAHRGQRRKFVSGAGKLASGAPALVPAVRALIRNAEISFEVGIDVHDGGMDFHEFHRPVEIRDNLGVVRHPVFGIIDQHRIDARIGHNVHLRGILRSGLSALLRGGGGGIGSHGRHPSLRDEPGAGQLVHGGGVLRHPGRGIGRTGDHGPEDARHSGDGHRFVHAVDGHVFRPRIFERKDLHHEIGDLRLFKGGDGG